MSVNDISFNAVWCSTSEPILAYCDCMLGTVFIANNGDFIILSNVYLQNKAKNVFMYVLDKLSHLLDGDMRSDMLKGIEDLELESIAGTISPVSCPCVEIKLSGNVWTIRPDPAYIADHRKNPPGSDLAAYGSECIVLRNGDILGRFETAGMIKLIEQATIARDLLVSLGIWDLGIPECIAIEHALKTLSIGLTVKDTMVRKGIISPSGSKGNHHDWILSTEDEVWQY